MLMGLIPLENLPKYHDISSEKKEHLQHLVTEYNAGLEDVMVSFNTQKTDARAIFFDANALFKQMYSSEEIEANSASHCDKREDCQE